MIEELLRLASVLTGDAIDGTENFEGAEGNVAEVADGRGYKVEAGNERTGFFTGHERPHCWASILGVKALDTALLGEHGHGRHKILHAHNANDATAFGYGDERQTAPGAEAADGSAQGVLGPRHLEGSRHDRLHITVAVITERVDDALAADDADQFRSADHGKIFLQGVNAADERVSQRIGRGESGEIGEHDFAHSNGVDNGLEEHALVFDLSADHDEETGDAEPIIPGEHTDHDGGERKRLAQTGCGAGSLCKAVRARETGANQPAEIERISGEQVKDAEKELHPNHATKQIAGGNVGLAEERDGRTGSQYDQGH